MERVPFYSDQDIIGAIRGSTRGFDAMLPEVQDERSQRDQRIWYAAMDAVALSLGVEWRKRDDLGTTTDR